MVNASALFFWELLERISNFFYDPTMYWGVPLILAVLWAIFRRTPPPHPSPKKGEGDQARNNENKS